MNLICIEHHKYTFYSTKNKKFKKLFSVQSDIPIDKDDLEAYRKNPNSLLQEITPNESA
jgi:hypothetical protein